MPMEIEREGAAGEEDMGAEEDIGAEEDMGAEPGGGDVYDPNVLYWRLYGPDWRDNAVLPAAAAIGLNRPPIQNGRCLLVDVIPGIANLTNMKEGGKAPYDFTAFRHALRYFFPPECSDRAVRAAAAALVNIYVPRGIQMGSFFGRGLYFLELDTRPVFQATPVDTIGAAGGYVILGGADAATAQNMGTSRRDGYPLVDQWKLRTGGPSITAKIEWSPPDLLYLGAGAGIGAPWALDAYTIPSAVGPQADDEVIIPAVARLLVGISWELWGRRGLNPRAGTMPRAARPRRRRR